MPRPLNQVTFSRRELNRILDLYGRKVAAGEWRDYAIDFLKDRAVFSVFRRASEVPIYRIEKNPKLARRQGAYSVISATGLIVRRGHELDRVLRAIDKSLRIGGGLALTAALVAPGPKRALHQHACRASGRISSRSFSRLPTCRSRSATCSADRGRLVAESPMTAIIWRKPQFRAALDQRHQQGLADAAAVHVGCDIDRVLDREAIGRPRAVGPGIGIAGERAVDLGDEIGKLSVAAARCMRRVISASSGGSSSNDAVPCSTAWA